MTADVDIDEKLAKQEAASLLGGGELEDADEEAKESKREPMQDIPQPQPGEDHKKAPKAGKGVGSAAYERHFTDLNKRKEEAKVMHSNGKYDESMAKYNQCLDIMAKLRRTAKDIPEEEFVEREAVLYNNIAVTYKQKQENTGVIQFTTKAIDSATTNRDVRLKAYKLRGFAHEAVDKLKLAKEDWTKVKEMEPGNIDASKALARIQMALQKDSAQRVVDSVGENIRKLDQFKLKGNEFYKASKLHFLSRVRGLSDRNPGVHEGHRDVQVDNRSHHAQTDKQQR
jgi:tetratricopeptide (TPR) repeat protein